MILPQSGAWFGSVMLSLLVPHARWVVWGPSVGQIWLWGLAPTLSTSCTPGLDTRGCSSPSPLSPLNAHWDRVPWTSHHPTPVPHTGVGPWSLMLPPSWSCMLGLGAGSSAQGSPLFERFGRRGVVAPLPHHQMSRPVSNSIGQMSWCCRLDLARRLEVKYRSSRWPFKVSSRPTSLWLSMIHYQCKLKKYKSGFESVEDCLYRVCNNLTKIGFKKAI